MSKVQSLKKGLRFTDAMRRQLALAVAEASFTGQAKEFNETQAYIAERIIGTAYQKHDFSRLLDKNGNLMNVKGLLPFMTHFPVKIGEQQLKISLGKGAPVPFVMFNDAAYFYSQLSQELRDEITSFAETSKEYVIARDQSEAKLYKFIKQYSSPKMLLGTAPDFEQHIPADWLEEAEVAEGTKTLAEILAEADEE